MAYRTDVFWLLFANLALFSIKKVDYLSPEIYTTTFTTRSFSLFEDSCNFITNFWIFRKSCLFTNQKVFKRGMFLLILLMAGDVEIQPGPMYQDLGELLSHKGFSILHQNIRGLTGKKDIISDLLFHHKNINILSLSETFLSTQQNDVEGVTFLNKEIVKMPREVELQPT